MQSALEQPALLDRPVREVMDAPLPELEASWAVERLAALLTRETPAALVRDGGRLAGIVSRYDVLQIMIGR
jgi:cystathionine beta-synthase